MGLLLYDANLDAYTLTATAGSLSLSGAPGGLRCGRRVSAAQSMFALAGSSVGFSAAGRLSPSTGSFTLGGSNAGLSIARLLTAETGLLSLTGGAALFTARIHHLAPPARTFSAPAESRTFAA